jgi:hypothetical protein
VAADEVVEKRGGATDQDLRAAQARPRWSRQRVPVPIKSRPWRLEDCARQDLSLQNAKAERRFAFQSVQLRQRDNPRRSFNVDTGPAVGTVESRSKRAALVLTMVGALCSGTKRRLPVDSGLTRLPAATSPAPGGIADWLKSAGREIADRCGAGGERRAPSEVNDGQMRRPIAQRRLVGQVVSGIGE